VRVGGLQHLTGDERRAVGEAALRAGRGDAPPAEQLPVTVGKAAYGMALGHPADITRYARAIESRSSATAFRVIAVIALPPVGERYSGGMRSAIDTTTPGAPRRGDAMR